MSLSTSNKFGKISISDDAVRTVASHAALECYGVVDLVSKSFIDSINNISGRRQHVKGVTVQILDNLIYVELFVILKLGVNIEAVKMSLSDAVKFSVETFTGMSVKRVHVNVVGIRV